MECVFTLKIISFQVYIYISLSLIYIYKFFSSFKITFSNIVEVVLQTFMEQKRG